MRLRHLILLGIALFIFIARFRPMRFMGSLRPVTESGPQAVRITQFYASDPAVHAGEPTKLCYGVDHAKTVRLDPPVANMWPALTRCVELIPPHTTTYKLTAEDESGQAATAATTVLVGPPRTKLLEVSVNKIEVKKGEMVTLCFKAVNATSYDVGRLRPAAVNSPGHACFADFPQQTKTYKVQVSGPGGTDSEKVTVKVQ